MTTNAIKRYVPSALNSPVAVPQTLDGFEHDHRRMQRFKGAKKPARR